MDAQVQNQALALAVSEAPWSRFIMTRFLLLLVLTLETQAAYAGAVLMREPADGDMRLGQRVLVDDGSCPSGQIKEVTASKLTPQGIQRTRTCIKR